jgi:hypothetical protein
LSTSSTTSLASGVVTEVAEDIGFVSLGGVVEIVCSTGFGVTGSGHFVGQPVKQNEKVDTKIIEIVRIVLIKWKKLKT